ncbi:MAG: HIT domain-containing protein [Bacteriovorax sp.]|nr:HIT domain-containing protein [Bacteriovorax sp.]
MNLFSIEPELEKNSYCVADLELSRVFVKNDKENPWFILVPRKNQIVELVDLTHEEQCMLMEEVSIVSEFLKTYYQPKKINIGALGNMVRQFHFHVIARFENDRTWPQALWGTTPEILFEQVELENIKSNFQEFIE